MTPLLFFIGIPPAVAVATEANQIVASSFSGALAHLRRKTVDLKMGWILVSGGLIGSGIGVQIFKVLRDLGQVELLVTLCYVFFLGIGLRITTSVSAADVLFPVIVSQLLFLKHYLAQLFHI